MITLKHGKFFKDGEPMPLEFGNKEQIKILERVERLKTEGEEIDQEFITNEACTEIIGTEWAIRCVCGDLVFFKADKKIIDLKSTCSCGLTFVNDKDDFMVVKLKK